MNCPRRQVRVNRSRGAPLTIAPRTCSPCNSARGPSRCWLLATHLLLSHLAPSLARANRDVQRRTDAMRSVAYTFNSQFSELVVWLNSKHGLQEPLKSKQLRLSKAVRDNMFQFRKQAVSNSRLLMNSPISSSIRKKVLATRPAQRSRQMEISREQATY